ncbi:MAG: GGDEF domain-containing protein, partial [Rhodospirillales bacterium]|nr:GGDEF domain-containing protein [Rhodospirillales bacterium]
MLLASYSVKLLTNLRFFLLALMVVIFLGVIAATVWLIYEDRQHEITHSSESMQSLAMVLSKEADSTLTLADTVLTGLITDLELHSLGAFSDTKKIHLALDQKRQILLGDGETPSFAHLFVLGPDGFGVTNSVSHLSARIDVSGRSYFNFHLDNKTSDLHISQPAYSKVTQERIIFLTRRLEDTSGEFMGVIGIHLKLRHFDHLYGSLKLPPGGTVTVIRADGWGVFRYPLADPFFEKSVYDEPGFMKMMSRKAGHWKIIKSPYDDALRVAGYFVSDKYPLLSVVSITHDSVLINWLQNTIRTAIIAGAGALFIIALALFSHRQIGHLIYALQLSSHDSLTGLWNRRAFDDRMDEEWRRAIRREQPMSLFFVDVDFFKLYNDEYGHRAGDKCLKALATTMVEDFARGGEFVARYGGEEFVILLPNTELSAAEKSATHLLDTIHGLQIPHKNSTVSSYVTISVGVATLVPTQDTNMDDLTEIADNALYDAKEREEIST